MCDDVKLEVLIGKTRAMLVRAMSLRANAEQLPILIYGASWEHASLLANEFERLAREFWVACIDRHAYEIILDGTDRFEFRAIEENSPPGKDYADIAVDHFVLERDDSKDGKTCAAAVAARRED